MRLISKPLQLPYRAELLAAVLLLFFFISASLPLPVAASPGLAEAAVEEPFQQILLRHPDLALGNHARIIAVGQNRWALIGVAQVAPDKITSRSRQALVRIGAIQARANLVKRTHGVKVTTFRGAAETSGSGSSPSRAMSLSTFFQATEESASARIKHLPVVGSWWNNNQTSLQVAVGTVEKGQHAGQANQSAPKSGSAAASPVKTKGKAAPDIAGETPFVALLQAASVLRNNGGVRLFTINDQLKGKQKAILSVAAANISGSPAQAERIARLKATRQLLAQKNGIQVSSVEILSDRESLAITDKNTTRASLSQALSIQEEAVNGSVATLPVVARWMNTQKNSLYICIGRLVP